MMSPSRVDGTGLAATVKLTFPGPCPVRGVRLLIQGASVEAVQAHSDCVVTVMVPVPAPAATWGGPTSVTSHLAGDGPTDVVEVEPQATATSAVAIAMNTETTDHGPPAEVDRGVADIVSGR